MASNFEISITVTQDDLDELEHVNNVRYVQWIQDISKEHWLTVAPEAIRAGVIWVVMHHSIHYKASAQLGDVIKARTFIEKSGGATCTRIVEMHNETTNILLVRSSTKWCLLNEISLRPTRISESIKQLFE